MATVTGSANGLLVVDPDGSKNPVTIEFPDSTLLVEGTTFAILNQNRTSTTTMDIQANSGSSSDDIIDPTDRSAAPASTHSSLTLTRYYVEWVLVKTGHVNPTWYTKVVEEK